MSNQQEGVETPVPVRVKGVYIAEAQGSSPAPVVLLEDDTGRIVPIFVGLSEAISIHHALTGGLAPRPMTHDLFVSVLDSLKASIIRVLIDELEGGIYYARLTIKSDSQEQEIDARPSDCLALAIRVKAPVEIRENVVVQSNISKGEVDKLTNIDDFLQ
jgi:bifunctional DNase/RNase